MRFPITIGLHRSFFASALIFGLGIGVCIVLWTPVWPIEYRLPAFFLALISVGHSWRRHQPKFWGLRLEKNGTLNILESRFSTPVEAGLLKPLVVHYWLIVFSYQNIDGRSQRVILFPDSASREQLRRLRVILRWQTSISAGDV